MVLKINEYTLDLVYLYVYVWIVEHADHLTRFYSWSSTPQWRKEVIDNIFFYRVRRGF